MEENRRLPWALLSMRLGVFVVMAVWTLDKFVRPDHAAKVYENFYLLKGVGPLAMQAIGVAEGLLLLGFVAGFRKRWTYGAVLLLHGVSTLSSWQIYVDPFGEGPRLLFFAAWPMLAACFALYLLRDADRMWVVDRTG